MQTVGVAWHVYQLTHSAFFLGILGIVGFFPTLLVFLPAGVIVDRLHKKDILLACELLLGGLAFLLFLATQLHIITLGLLFSLLFLSSLINTLETPARIASVPLIAPAEHLPQMLSLNSVTRQIGSVLGPALAGFCIALYGVQSIYLINAISYFLFFGAILFITIPKVTAKVGITKEAVVEGLRFVKNNSLIATTMLLDFFATFFAGAMVLLPVFAKVVLHVGPQELGLLYAAPSAGALLAGVYISTKPQISHQGKLLLAAIAIYSLGIVGFGLSSWFIVSFIFLAVSGAGDMISAVIRNIIRQQLTPLKLQGRVASIIMVFFLGGPYLGDTEAGFIAGFVGAPLSVVLGGLVTLLMVCGVAWKVPQLRHYQGIGGEKSQ